MFMNLRVVWSFLEANIMIAWQKKRKQVRLESKFRVFFIQENYFLVFLFKFEGNICKWWHGWFDKGQLIVIFEIFNEKPLDKSSKFQFYGSQRRSKRGNSTKLANKEQKRQIKSFNKASRF